MSIIHEALKKAERDREPLLHAVFTARQMPQHHAGWTSMGFASVLLGGVIGAIGTILWLMTSDILPLVTISQPRAVETSQELEVMRPELAGILEVSTVALPPFAGAPAEPHEFSLMRADPTPPDIATGPGEAEALFDRAVTAEAEGQWDEAVQYYRESLAKDPHLLKGHNNLGNLYIRQNRLPEAIAQLQAVLELDPGYAYARNNLGSAYLMTGQEIEAIREFLAALRLDSTYVSPYYNLAAVYARQGDVAQALAFLTKAMALEPAVRTWVAEDEDFDAIRSVPAFQQLRRPNHANR